MSNKKLNVIKEIDDSLNKISKYSTKSKILEYKNLLNDDKFEELAYRLIDEYYDPKYEKSMKEYNYLDIINFSNIERVADEIGRKYSRLII